MPNPWLNVEAYSPGEVIVSGLSKPISLDSADIPRRSRIGVRLGAIPLFSSNVSGKWTDICVDVGGIRTRVNAYKCYIRIFRFWGVYIRRVFGHKMSEYVLGPQCFGALYPQCGYNILTRGLGTVSIVW